MARRPDDARGTLIFQEGKCIEGEYYIIAVYDDPSSCPRVISFCAYELENDCTFTYPLTYNEFDLLFKYDAELMNPSNQDGRFHWVIQRLDFVQNNSGQKILCLAQEPTPDEDDDFDVLADDKPKAKTSMAPANMGGKVDAATKVKLLKELDTQDDHKLHVQLVKSEDARKRFISKLQAQRLLQIEKASQRLLKVDEEREARLVKLDFIKQQQSLKAQELKERDAANKSTVAQLELLMKQKEAQAIRRLIQEKDEQDRGMGREKDAARQRRKMQERSEKEVAAIEAERAKTQARKREDQVEKRENMIHKRNRQLAEKVREVKETRVEADVVRQEEKDLIVQALWQGKSDKRQAIMKNREEFVAMDEVREKRDDDRRRKRAHTERDQLKAMREADKEDKADLLARRRDLNKESLLQWKIGAANRALIQRGLETRIAGREKRIQEREELRLRRFRETQFLETAQKNRTMSPEQLAAMMGGDSLGDDGDATLLPDQGGMAKNPGELADFKKSYEQQERVRRHEERMAKRKTEDVKLAKLSQLAGPDPNAREIIRISKMRQDQAATKKKLEEARLKKELDHEAKVRNQAEAMEKRQQLTDHLETKRRDRSREKEKLRIDACVARVKGMPIGAAMPRVLVY